MACLNQAREPSNPVHSLFTGEIHGGSFDYSSRCYLPFPFPSSVNRAESGWKRPTAGSGRGPAFLNALEAHIHGVFQVCHER